MIVRRFAPFSGDVQLAYDGQTLEYPVILVTFPSWFRHDAHGVAATANFEDEVVFPPLRASLRSANVLGVAVSLVREFGSFHQRRTAVTGFMLSSCNHLGGNCETSRHALLVGPTARLLDLLVRIFGMQFHGRGIKEG